MSFSNLVTAWTFSEGRATPVDLFQGATITEALSGVSGHFGLHQQQGPEHRLLRDPLGVNKLFFALNDDGVVSSPFLIELLEAGHALADISSVPWGHAITLNTRAQAFQLEKVLPLDFGSDDDDFNESDFLSAATHIRHQLDESMAMIARACTQRSVYVTLSGGLDSSSIAALAKAQFPALEAVTFSMAGSSFQISDDLLAARRVAKAFDLTLHEVHLGAPEVLELLDDTLAYGQDWRDFNVHCGLVNAALARFIGERHQASKYRPVVLTGDTMNELLADYSAVEYEGHDYYALPRLDKSRVRRFLVQGLDAGDREVGIFAHFGVDCLQPFALVAGLFASLPGRLIAEDRAKQRLFQNIMRQDVPAFVYERKKVRAQVGGETIGGTLAVLHDAGIDQVALAKRFAERLGIAPGAEQALIRAGRYRFWTQYPRPVAD